MHPPDSENFDLSVIAPAEVNPQGDASNLFDQEVEEYRRAQLEDDPDFSRKAEIALKVRELREAADDRSLDRKMRKDQHDRQMQMIDEILDARKRYANKIFWMVVVWLIAMGMILGLRGYYWKSGFVLSDKVLLALIGGTTLNVLGIFTIVANFLFPKNGGQLLAVAAATSEAAPAPMDKKATKNQTKKTKRVEA